MCSLVNIDSAAQLSACSNMYMVANHAIVLHDCPAVDDHILPQAGISIDYRRGKDLAPGAKVCPTRDDCSRVDQGDRLKPMFASQGIQLLARAIITRATQPNHKNIHLVSDRFNLLISPQHRNPHQFITPPLAVSI